MEEWKPLNMELRSWAISCVLRLEQTSSSLLRSMFRMFNEESKTLGNKASALSFKAKIDLLHDLEEISNLEYTHLIKIMEIRNQFAHNHNAVSFESLDTINPDINKYLLKHSPDAEQETVSREEKLKYSFENLFRVTVGKLMVLQIEYDQGMEKEIRKHINDLIIENIDEIWKNALEINKNPLGSIERENIYSGYSRQRNINKDKVIEDFFLSFKRAFLEYSSKELDKYKDHNVKNLFSRKKKIEEISEDIKQKKMQG